LNADEVEKTAPINYYGASLLSPFYSLRIIAHYLDILLFLHVVTLIIFYISYFLLFSLLNPIELDR
jgi:hypothetical protein